MTRFGCPMLLAAVLGTARVAALDYAHAPYAAGGMDPQPSGWPLTDAERIYALRPEHDRRPGREAGRHEPSLWPVTPAAGFWGGSAWLDAHASLVEAATVSRGPIDVLLVGDSITQQWGASWARNFPTWKTVNIGLGGDKTQNVLWRLDHGGVAGLDPRGVVLLIGNNNMFFTPETGVEAAARGIQTCLANLREKFPAATIVVVKILPAHPPGDRFHEDIRGTNTALDRLALDGDPKVRILDLSAELVDDRGAPRRDLYHADGIHLVPAGYDVFARALRPLLEPALAAPVPR